MTGRRAAIAVALAILLGACGQNDSSDLSPNARNELRANAAAAKSAAARHDAESAHRELAALQLRIEALTRDGHVSQSQATAIRASATRAEELLVLITTTTTTTATLPPVVSVPDNPTDQSTGKDKGKGGGKGHGKG